MSPVVHFLLKFKTVIELIHLYVLWVEALENLSKNPAVWKVTFGIGDLVGKVERHNPLV